MEFELIRIILAFFVGYLLSVSGSLTQLISNNVLSSPSTLGMDGVGVLFVIVSYLLTLSFGFKISNELLSFLISVIFIILVLLYSIYRNQSKNIYSTIWSGSSIKKVVLVGLSFNLFIGAIFSIIQFVFMVTNIDFPTGLWFGNFKQYQDDWIYIFTPVFIFSLLFLKYISSRIEFMNLGSHFAIGLGVDIERVQKSCLFYSLFVTCLIISFFGVFSFLGLIFPHILRNFNFFSLSMRNELVFGPLVTGLIFSVFDFFCYSFIIKGAELPVGMVSSIVGSFFLIYLILRSKISLG